MRCNLQNHTNTIIHAMNDISLHVNNCNNEPLLKDKDDVVWDIIAKKYNGWHFYYKNPNNRWVFDRLFELIQAPTSKRSKNKSRKQEPMTLVGLEGGTKSKVKRKYTRKNKQ